MCALFLFTFSLRILDLKFVNYCFTSFVSLFFSIIPFHLCNILLFLHVHITFLDWSRYACLLHCSVTRLLWVFSSLCVGCDHRVLVLDAMVFILDLWPVATGLFYHSSRDWLFYVYFFTHTHSVWIGGSACAIHHYSGLCLSSIMVCVCIFFACSI